MDIDHGGSSTGSNVSGADGNTSSAIPANCTSLPALPQGALPSRPWIALTRASTCPFWDRATVAQRLGATAVLVADAEAVPRAPPPIPPHADPALVTLVALMVGTRDADHVGNLLRLLGPLATGNAFDASVDLYTEPGTGGKSSRADVVPALVVALLIALVVILFNFRHPLGELLCKRCRRRERLQRRQRVVEMVHDLRTLHMEVISGRITVLPVSRWPGEGEGESEDDGGTNNGVAEAVGCSSSHAACAVCLDDFVAGDELRSLPCAHHFHVACIDPWLARKPDCPLCKAPIGGRGVAQHITTQTLAALLIGRSNRGARYSLSPRDALTILQAMDSDSLTSGEESAGEEEGGEASGARLATDFSGVLGSEGGVAVAASVAGDSLVVDEAPAQGEVQGGAQGENTRLGEEYLDIGDATPQ